ncbi:DciA family protein [Thiomicrospira sp.]|uniref:DciA family protein n=1 Tax=Thiomicrospira sp. TaxID=935 RepID=UPI002F91D6F6
MKHLLQESSLTKLFQQAELYQALLELGRSALPENLAIHLTGVSIEQQTLICLTDGANWASKLRFFEQTLLHHYDQNLPHLKLNQVYFKVMVDLDTPAGIKRSPNRPDEKAAEQMKTLSKTLPPKLADALTKLSQRAQSNKDRD